MTIYASQELLNGSALLLFIEPFVVQCWLCFALTSVQRTNILEGDVFNISFLQSGQNVGSNNLCLPYNKHIFFFWVKSHFWFLSDISVGRSFKKAAVSLHFTSLYFTSYAYLSGD